MCDAETIWNEYYKNSHENAEAGNQHKSIKGALCVCNNLNILRQAIFD